MSDGFYPIILEDWPECKFEGCVHNQEDGCNSALTAMRIEKRIITGDFNCTAALVPHNTCDFCGAELIEVEGCETCPEGRFKNAQSNCSLRVYDNCWCQSNSFISC